MSGSRNSTPYARRSARSLSGRSAGVAGALALDGPAEELGERPPFVLAERTEEFAFRPAHQAAPLLPARTPSGVSVSR
ncbi:hypothetical protein GCM10027612_26910 [Microbispora bryophytorum subsp. camponoti]